MKRMPASMAAAQIIAAVLIFAGALVLVATTALVAVQLLCLAGILFSLALICDAVTEAGWLRP